MSTTRAGVVFSFVCGLLLFPAGINAACTGSSPTWTCGPTYTEINNLINSGSPAGFTRGDTVNVSAGDGTENWGSLLTITKGVQLIGPGRDSLIITHTSGTRAIEIAPDSTSITNEEQIRIKGFTFDGNSAREQLIHVTGAPSSGTKPYRYIIIEQNKFQNQGTTNVAGNGVLYFDDQVRGVIANNLFHNVTYLIRYFGGSTCGPWTNSGNFPIDHGTSDQLYFEGNTITWDASYPDGVAHGYTETGQSGRLVQRYNTWNMSTTDHNGEIWDQHGFQAMSGSCVGQTGTMVTEAYGNTISNKVASFKLVSYRGSKGLLFNNIFTTTSGGGGSPPFAIQQYDTGCNTAIGLGWTVHTPGAVPSSQPDGTVNKLYGFNNTVNGSEGDWSADPDSGSGGINQISGCAPLPNEEFWELNTGSCTSSACTAGIGRGTTAPSGTCTLGTGYWVAPTATPTVDYTIVQQGAFYRCSATNTWTLYYQPYTYPHPLRSDAVAATPGLRFDGGVQLNGGGRFE